MSPESPDVTYSAMRWNTPLSEDHAGLLLERLDPRPGDQLLDLGCGWGELLLRALARGPGTEGVGVDTLEWALDRARETAAERDLAGRVRFVAQDAATWDRPADRVVCVGTSHAWDGSAAALTALAGLARPGDRLLFGDGFWEHPPSLAAVEILGEDIPSLSELAGHAVRAGWRILHLSTADQREWDEFESTWRAGREQWLLAHPDDPGADEVRSQLDRRLGEYLTGYRGVLGFAYFVLARSGA